MFFSPQQWELIDPLTGRNVEPKKAPQRQGEIKKNNVATPKNIPDSLFDQFFQRHTRNERFQPGPELAPESESVANHHQAISKNSNSSNFQTFRIIDLYYTHFQINSDSLFFILQPNFRSKALKFIQAIMIEIILLRMGDQFTSTINDTHTSGD